MMAGAVAGAGGGGYRSRRVRLPVQVGAVAGAGGGGCWCRWEKEGGTGATGVRRMAICGAGPPPKIPPAPRLGTTCTKTGQHLHQDWATPAPMSGITCTEIGQYLNHFGSSCDTQHRTEQLLSQEWDTLAPRPEYLTCTEIGQYLNHFGSSCDTQHRTEQLLSQKWDTLAPRPEYLFSGLRHPKTRSGTELHPKARSCTELHPRPGPAQNYPAWTTCRSTTSPLRWSSKQSELSGSLTW